MAIINPHSPYGGLRNVDTDDIVQGCNNWLRSKTLLMDMLGTIPGPLPRTPLLYQNELDVVMENTESNALVIKNAGGWGSPNSGNTVKYPRIALEFWCDSLRDPYGGPIEKNEAIRRIQFIYEQFDKHLHRPDTMDIPESGKEFHPLVEGKIQWWGTVRTIGCTRLGEFSFYEVPDAEGLFLGTVYYGVTVG